MMQETAGRTKQVKQHLWSQKECLYFELRPCIGIDEASDFKRRLLHVVNMAARLHQKVAENTNLCKQMTAILQSPIGAIQVSGCREGIHSIQLQESFVPKDRTRVASFHCNLSESQEEMTAPVKHCMTWLEAYFCEPWTTGKLPLPPFHHRIFQQATFTCNVLRILQRDVKFGEVTSYKQLATLAGNSKAVRAVGGAMRSNPLLEPASCLNSGCHEFYCELATLSREVTLLLCMN
ncbi:methylated-DNA--protein-cysteine methyltransferase isoform X3 [Narcine bancroftii]|uniref:methylated-DNA--protein-cysteine methyltransferase isoform X3 n=1 Tax=Narcine bancroftii TaxID=1343680 RepID=UPI0038316E2D